MPGRNAVTRWSATGAALCAGLILSTSAHAGAFAIREQSSYYQGMSFAGAAAGDDISAMFWNSAAAAAAPGMNVSANAALVVPQREITATGGAFLGSGFFGAQSGNIGDPTFVPATYGNYQLNEQLFLGVALNSGFGFTTKPENQGWAGSPIGITSKIFSVNLNPNLAYKLTDTLTIGAGLQVQYVDVRLRSGPDNGVLSALPGSTVPGPLPGRETEGDDWGAGATAGIIWEPAPGTSLGVGFRSAIDVKLEGTCTGQGATNPPPLLGCNPAPAGEPVTAEFTLPELVSVGLSHQLTERFRVLGTVEWTNWSRLGTPLVLDTTGTPVDALELEYEDGWYYSIGAEYAYSPNVILRAGLGYEESPIGDDTRNIFLPDDERIWLSLGASAKLSESTKVDLGYSHLFIEDSPICQPQPGCTAATSVFFGEATGDIDIVTLGLTHNFGGPEPELESLK
jgi:long-chain fatty acid transport protein